MKTNVKVRVNDGSFSLLFDDWSGAGALVDLFDEHYDDSLRFFALRDIYVEGV